MAEVIQVQLDIETKKAQSNVENLSKDIVDLNKDVVKGNKATEKSLEGIEKTSEKTAGGVKKIGGALKALGIGLIIAGFAKFMEVLNENQKVADFFSITFETLSLAFNDFFNFILSNTDAITNFFKAAFDDPLQNMKDFGKAIVENVTERIQSSIDTLGYLAEAVVKVFKGDFAGAMDAAKNAGKELIDVVTGVDDSFDKTVEAVDKVVTATSNYVKETIKGATENVNLAKTAELAAVANQGLIEKYDLQAEKLRQVRDEERNSIADRIKANNDLKAVLDEQEKTMLANVNAILAAAKAQHSKNQNDANQIALKEAQNEVAAVEAQIAGFRSEQKSNDLALDRESIELTNSKLESESKLSIEQKRFNAEQIEDELARLEALKEVDILEAEQESIRLQAIIDNANAGTQAKVDAQIALDEFMSASGQTSVTREKEISDAKIEIAKKERDAKITALNGYAAALSSISGIMGQEAGKGKALAIASSLVSTYAAIAGQLKAFAGVPVPGYAIAQAIATGLVGLANVKKIASVKIPESTMGGSSQTGSLPAASTPPAFNVVGQGETSQLANAIGSQASQPMRAYVVSNDVTTAQGLERNIVEGATI